MCHRAQVAVFHPVWDGLFLSCYQLTFQLLGIVLSLRLICPRCAGTTDALDYLLLFWAAGSIKVRSSCLYDKHCIHCISTAHVFVFCVCIMYVDTYATCMWVNGSQNMFVFLILQLIFWDEIFWTWDSLTRLYTQQASQITGVHCHFWHLLHQGTHWAISVAPLFKEWNSSLYIEFHLWVYLASLTLALEISHMFLMFRHIQGARQQKPFLTLMKTVFKWRMTFLVSETIPLYCIRTLVQYRVTQTAQVDVNHLLVKLSLWCGTETFS